MLNKLVVLMFVVTSVFADSTLLLKKVGNLSARLMI
jgi:hypothetical protein